MLSLVPDGKPEVHELLTDGIGHRPVAFEKIFDEDVEPKAYVEANGLKTVEDTGMLESVVDKVLADNPKTVEEYHSGKTKVLGFLVGQVMKQMKGKANPASVNKMLMEKL